MSQQRLTLTTMKPKWVRSDANEVRRSAEAREETIPQMGYAGRQLGKFAVYSARHTKLHSGGWGGVHVAKYFS